MNTRIAAAASAVSTFLLSMPVWADTPAEPPPVSKGGTLIALAVMALLVIGPILYWWVKSVRKPKDKV